MSREPVIVQPPDPDAFEATEVYGPNGARQLRVLDIKQSPEHDGLLFMDLRDVNYLVESYNELVWGHRFFGFWGIVEYVFVLDKVESCCDCLEPYYEKN